MSTTQTTEPRWKVTAFTGGIVGVVYQGDEMTCRVMAAGLVGKPLTMLRAPGLSVTIGTIIRTEVSPA